MEEILVATAQQVPALVVLVVLVIIFGRAIVQVSRDFKDYLQKRDAHIEMLQTQSTEAIKENSIAIKENSIVLGRTVNVLERVEQAIDGTTSRS